MSEVDLTEAAADLAGLVARACAGEEVVILESGRAVAKLVALPRPQVRRGPRILGRLEGQMTIPDDFDAPLPDDLLDLFEGRP